MTWQTVWWKAHVRPGQRSDQCGFFSTILPLEEGVSLRKIYGTLKTNFTAVS